MHAVQHASESARLGLVSPCVLLIGIELRDIATSFDADVAQLVQRGKVFRPLWRAVARRHAEIEAEDRKRQHKVESSPNAYVCAAEGCGIRGEKKAALRACGGRCPPEVKPHYCSRGCQRRVRSL